MNRFYEGWLQTARAKAEGKGLTWNPAFDAGTGKIIKPERWGLGRMIGLPPPEQWLSGFQHHESDVHILNGVLALHGTDQPALRIMSPDWREFLQASIAHELLVKRNKVGQAIAVMRAIKTLSLCSASPSPWEITAADVQRAYNVGLKAGESGKLAMNTVMVVKSLFDNEHLGNKSPLAQYAKPYPDHGSQTAQKAVTRQKRRERSNHNVHDIRSKLADRTTAERLPEMRALWELVRIIFTETPLTFTDRARFSALRLQFLAGIRIGESILVPVDCLSWRDYFDSSGVPAGESGGFSRSLSFRYFVLKRDNDDVGSDVRLVEELQDVPPIFETMFVDIVNDITAAVAPLRQRLEQQTNTGRLIPEYEPDALVSAAELYTRVAGSIRITNEPISLVAIKEYRESHSLESLAAIRLAQQLAAKRLPVTPVGKYWSSQTGAPPALNQLGRRIEGPIRYEEAYFRVSEVEAFIRAALPTKLPDTDPFLGPDGKSLFPYQLLFLHPPRSLIEGRNGGIIDIERYFSVGRLSAGDLHVQLTHPTMGLFARYGKTEEDKCCSLTSHATRHLQNAELFRLGVADTIITKRFGRKTTAQSHTYDHKSLAESLDSIDLPPAAVALIPERAHDTLKLILAGKVRGPLVDEFLHVQLTRGDEAAFEYLAAEADGLHVTPYGFCLSSFTVDPCPKHLQCFNGCLHLGRTDDPNEQTALEKVRDRTSAVLVAAEASPGGTAGRKNQISHAKTILENISVAINTAPGAQVFPEGLDLSMPVGRPTNVIDAAIQAQNNTNENR